MERNHYKAEAQKYEQQVRDITDSQKAEASRIEAATKKQDEARAVQSKISAKTIFDLQQQHLKDIHELKDRNMVISDGARRVFNDTPTSGPQSESTSGSSNGSDVAGSATLENLLVANEVNKSNYLACKDDKDSWIKLWYETQTNLNGAIAQ